MIQALQALTNQVLAPQANQQYKDAIIHMPYFSGQPLSDTRRCTPASKGLIEVNVDRFLWLFNHFRQSNPNFDHNLLRRALYERLTGAAAEFMRLQCTDNRFTLDNLLTRLRVRFVSPRTFKEVSRDIDTIKKREGEMIAHLVGRLDHLYMELVTLNEMTPELKDQALFNKFKVICTDQRLRERITAAGYNHPAHLNMAVAMAQEYYNSYELAPWSAHLNRADRDRGEKDRKASEKGKRPVNAISEKLPKKFNGRCFKCDQEGHREADCLLSGSLNHIKPKREGGKTPTSAQEKVCFYCRQPGHSDERCFTFARILKFLNRSKTNGGPSNTPTNQTPPTNPRGATRGGSRGGGRGRGRGGRMVNTIDFRVDALTQPDSPDAPEAAPSTDNDGHQEN